MVLEVIDINRVSSVRPGTVVDVKGTRIQIAYNPNAKTIDHTNSLWCDERSQLIHPVGWAQLVGHELISTKEYSESSMDKIKTNRFDNIDANHQYFPHLYKQMNHPYSTDKSQNFEINMKVEAIDALNSRSISVASVTKVLRFGYLMIGIDGMTSEDGSDAFCLHRSECLPILPKSYTERYNIPLTIPESYNKKKFNYKAYLKDVGAIAAPECLFKEDLPDEAHSFEEGDYLEAVILTRPHLICPAIVKQVCGKLLKISFPGWSENYDQWVDYRSAEIYPIGYCSITGYMLEHPLNWLKEKNIDLLDKPNDDNVNMDVDELILILPWTLRDKLISNLINNQSLLISNDKNNVEMKKNKKKRIVH